MKINLFKLSGLAVLCAVQTQVFAVEGGGLLTEPKASYLKSALRAKPITGTVRDETGATLPGVSVKVRGTMKVAVTTASGQYTIDANEGDVLEFVFIGYTTKSITVGASSTYNTSLEVNTRDLQEVKVVAVGYGNVSQKEVTSAVTVVDSAQFRQSGSRNPLDLLIGKVAGLQITRTSGTNPNSGVSVQLRGVTSITGSNTPLIIVDGIPGGNLDLLQQDDIESFSVLKDGSAAAIYGTRANGGVIIVTTKKGKAGPARFDYNGYVRTETLFKKPDFMSAAEYRQKIQAGQFPLGVDAGGSFDYYDEFVGGGNVSNNHNLSVSGGAGSATYRVAGNFRDIQGFARENDRTEYTLRASVLSRGFDDKIGVQVNAASNFNRANLLGGGGGGFENVLTRNPTLTWRNPDGSWLFEPTGTNELARLVQERSSRDQQTTSLDAKVDIKLIEGLNASVFGALIRNSYLDSEYRYRAGENSQEAQNPFTGTGYASRNTLLGQEFNLEPTLTYDRTIGDKHKVSGLAGYSYRRVQSENFNANNRGYQNDVFEDNNLGSVTVAVNGIGIGSNKSANILVAYFGRVNYAFNDRYFLTGIFRREGSSRFGASNKYANFPAVSAGWQVSDESFMENVKWVDNLKFRVGYGETGNSQFENDAALVTLSGGGLYRFPDRPDATAYQQTYGPARNPNPDLRWERKKETNIGIEFGLFNNKLTGQFDVFQRKTIDLLDTYTTPQPPFVQSNLYTNVGTISAKGIELALTYNAVKTRNFSYSIDFTGSTTNNKLDSYSNDVYKRDLKTFADIGGFGALGQAIRTYEGRNIGEFWGKRFAGLDAAGKWTFFKRDGSVTNNAGINTSAFRDQTDLAVIGNAIPKYYLSMGHSFAYKGFDLRAFFRSKLDYQILNSLAMQFANPSVSSSNLLRSAFTEYAAIKDTYMYSDYYVEEGSFLKLDEATLGYTFKLKAAKVRNLRAYISGQNLFLITGYSGNDPDQVQDQGLAPGVDGRGPYPTTRQFLFGLNFGF